MDEPVTAATPAVGEPAARSDATPASTPTSPSRWSWLLRLIGVSVVAALLALLGWATLRAGEGGGLPAQVVAGDEPPAPAFSLNVLWPRAVTWPPALRRALRDGRVDLRDFAADRS